MLKKWKIALALGVSVALPGSWVCWAQDVPFAQTVGAGSSTASLSDLMTSVLQRHALLWSSGQSENWPFAAYEIGQLRSRFFEAASAYRNIPVEVVAAMTKALDEVQASVDHKNKAQFVSKFDAATAACNACHAAAGISFIQIRRPKAPVVTNLNFPVQPSGLKPSR